MAAFDFAKVRVGRESDWRGRSVRALLQASDSDTDRDPVRGVRRSRKGIWWYRDQMLVEADRGIAETQRTGEVSLRLTRDWPPGADESGHRRQTWQQKSRAKSAQVYDWGNR